MKSEIILINPRCRTWHSKKYIKDVSCPPLGLLSIASYLREKGHQVKVFDFATSPVSLSNFFSLLNEIKPKMVGITCMTEAVSAVREICQVIKSWHSQCFTIVGGPHPTFMDLELLTNNSIDCVVRGEGEITMKELADRITGNDFDLSSIEGISYKCNGGIVRNKARSFLCSLELDNLPLPARDLVNLSAYRSPKTLVSSRGCPYSCIFCAAGAMGGRKYRTVSAEKVLEELEELAAFDRHYNRINFMDDTFTANKRRAKEICSLIIESKLNIEFGCESRADVFDEELAFLLKNAGCKAIQFGIESGSDEILAKLTKCVTVSQIESAVRAARKAGIEVKGSVIIGHAFDTEATVKETMKFCSSLRRNYSAHIFFAMNIPFPGTFQYHNAEALGIKILSDNWDDFTFGNSIINTRYLKWYQIRDYWFDLV